jgi:hypothetical protein
VLDISYGELSSLIRRSVRIFHVVTQNKRHDIAATPSLCKMIPPMISTPITPNKKGTAQDAFIFFFGFHINLQVLQVLIL